MHILVLEMAMTGHHIVYLERVVAGYMVSFDSVTIGIPIKEIGNPRIQRLLDAYPNRLNVHQIEDYANLNATNQLLGNITRELRVRSILGRAYQEVHARQPVDYVFVPYVDYCLHAIGLIGSPFNGTRWGGICMRPSFHYQHYGVIAPVSKLDKIKKMLFFRVLKDTSLNHLFTIDELLAHYTAQVHAVLARKLVYVADPAELSGAYTRESARAELNLPSCGKVILAYGAIDARKGVDLLIQSVNVLKEDIDDLHLLIVGRQSHELRNFLNSEAADLIRTGRCLVLDRFVSEEEQQMVFAACDYVWLGYRDHFVMSGVLVLAGISGRPVLATREGLIGWHVENNNLGLSIDTKNIISICNALRSVVHATGHSNFDRQEIKKKFLTHTWSQFMRTINCSVRGK